MLPLWWLYLAFTAYGSFYPFDFCVSAECIAAVQVQGFVPFAQSKTDILANIALFVPAGMLAVWLARRNGEGPSAPRAARLLLVALGWAVALQGVQFLLPDRVPSLGDIVWNALGLLAGASAARRTGPPAWIDIDWWRRWLDRRRAALLAAALAWPAARLAPFAPTSEISEIRANIGRVLFRPDLSATELGLAAAGFLATLWAAEALGLPRRFCLLAVPAVLVAQAFLPGRAIQAWDVAGGVAALLLWVLLTRLGLSGRGTQLSRLPASPAERP
ncbi:VanZ family protein [Arenibaculum pallidiluteum]|uniref:VanZ family protein n=1 Tax=Arenibaculum pallidiluteum TaxID=2812559 RepID=UPI001A976B34|nr:VanZ family protein [Arenibaculum pallidiluteum]